MDTLIGLLCAALGLALTVGPVIALLTYVVRTRRALEALALRVQELEAEVRATTLRLTRRTEPAEPAVAPAPPTDRVVPPAPAPVADPAVVEPAVAAPAPALVEAPPPRPAVPEPVLAAPQPTRAPPPPPPPAEPAPPPRPASPPFQLPGVETLAVWLAATLGGVGLVVAALFALGVAIERGYVGPPVRFALAMASGAGLWLFSELLRARGWRVPAAAMAGAGAAVLYGGLYAGHSLYGLVAQPVTMLAMVGVTAVTMLAAVRQDNVLLAILAVGGGYLTPILLSTGENRAVAFFSYLALIDVGVVYAATRRRWWPVVGVAGAVTAALHLGWSAQFRAPDQVLVGLTASLGLAAVFLALPLRLATRRAEALAGGLGGALLVLSGLVLVPPTDPMAVDPRSYEPLRWSLGITTWIAAAWLLAVTALLVWTGVRRADVFLRAPAAAVPSLAVLVFGVGWIFADAPDGWALGVGLVGAPLAAAAATRLAAGSATPARPWEAALLQVASGLAVLALLASGGERTPPLPPNEVYAAWLVGGAAVSALVGYGFGLRPFLLVGLGSGAAALHLLGGRLEEPGAGLLFGAAVVVYAVHAFPVLLRPRAGDLWGTLTAAAAGPALLLPFLALWEHALGDAASGGLAVLLGVPTLLASLTLARQVRADSRELALFVVVTLLFAAVAVPLQLDEAWLTVGWSVEVALLALLSRRLTHPVIRVFAAVLAAAVAIRLLANPEALAYGGGEGLLLLNWTLYTWGVPGVAFLVAARAWKGEPTVAPRALRVAAVLIFFALVNLEVAHAFARDDVLSFTSENLVESMTRSLAWGLYGLLILTIGFVSDSRVARLGGFTFALVAAGKVALVDTWSLSGFVRVGSWLGLAVVLIIAALLFQKVVLRERAP